MLLLLLLLPAVAAGSTLKLAVLIGNNRGHEAGRTLRYVHQDARKLHRVLTELGGFAPDNVHLLLEQGSGRAWQLLRSVEAKIRRHRSTPGNKALLLFYYSGHADGSVLELGDSSLEYSRLLGFLKRSGADVRLVFIDSCRSGRLLAAKGGRPGRGYRIQVSDEMNSHGYAVITSSAADELSQESMEVRGSFFTHYLVSALRGAGDISGDGRVTLAEAYRYTYARTVARTSGTVGGGQHPMYEFKLAGQGDVVLTRTLDAGSRLLFSPAASGRLVVLDSRSEEMVAESTVTAGEQVQLALAPGDYTVYLLSKGVARRGRVSLARGQHTRLDRRQLVPHRLARTVTKGGLFRRSLAQRLDAGLLVRRMPLELGDVALGPALGYHLGLTDSWGLDARLTWATAINPDVATGYHELGLQLGPSLRWRLSRLLLFQVGALVGYDHLFQDDRQGIERHTSAFSYLLLAEAGIPAGFDGRLVFYLNLGGGGRVFQLRDAGWVHRVDLQATWGIGWAWGD